MPVADPPPLVAPMVPLRIVALLTSRRSSPEVAVGRKKLVEPENVVAAVPPITATAPVRPPIERPLVNVEGAAACSVP